MQNIKSIVVEDDPFDAEFIQHQLTKLPYRISHKESLWDSIKHIVDHKCDVALLDLNVLDSQGEESVAFLSKYAPTFPIVVISGVEEKNLSMDPIDLGAQEFLQKCDVTSKVFDRSTKSSIRRHQKQRESKIQLYILDQALRDAHYEEGYHGDKLLKKKRPLEF